jgi:hypothetical protein
MGFGKSFDEAFKPAYVAGSAAALEAVKEKIKQNDAQRKSDTIADTLSGGIIQKANAEKRDLTEEEKQAINGITKLKSAKLEPSEFSTLLKLSNPTLFADETLVAQRESSTQLNQVVKAIAEFSARNAGIPLTGGQPQPQPTTPQAQTPSITSVGNSFGEQPTASAPASAPSEILVTKLPTGRMGGEFVNMESMKKVEEAQAFASAEGKYKQEKVQAGEKVFAGIRSWGKTMDEFEKAFPSTDKTPLKARVSAVITGNAVKLGLMNEPQLLAAQKSLETGARQALKDWGDKGALSNNDVSAAVRVLDLSNLTLAEKMAVVRGTSEKALNNLDDETLNATFERQPYMKDFVDSLGIRYGQEVRDSIVQTAKGSKKVNLKDLFS